MIDVELVAARFLREALDVPVYITPPKNVPGSYVRVTRLGGIKKNMVTDSALMGINCYAVERDDAVEIAGKAREALWSARAGNHGGVWVRWWREVSGPVNYPQPDVQRVRYQFSGELRLATN